MARREKMAPETEATPALPMSALVRPRFSRMMGISGAAAKVETTQVKKDIQERWKVRMCGLAKESRRMDLALCSESTGRSNDLPAAAAGVSSVEKAKGNDGSRAVTPCSELPAGASLAIFSLASLFSSTFNNPSCCYCAS